MDREAFNTYSEQLARLGVWLEAPHLRWMDVAEAIHLILLTGCQSGEISGLQWAEVLEDRLSLKTGGRDVILKRRCTGARSRYVFPSQRDPEKPIGPQDVPWRAIRLHDLRHTYASQAIMSGETLSMPEQLLGHRQPKTTEIYAHLDARHLAEAANRVSAIIQKRLDGNVHGSEAESWDVAI